MKYLLLALTVLVIGARAQAPYGAVPSPAQLMWHDMEYYMFIHFGPNTFTNKEWGLGDEDPRVFNPTELDCRQWARTAKAAGMKGIIITAKHHDGFCLWPSKYSTHTVRESPWKDGRGDVLRELSEACKAEGIKFGVYLSPWDRNHPKYGTEEYNQVFVNMLGEVLGNYGEVFEQWFDGANGEGPNGKKQVYDWKLFNATVYKYQPNAIIFSDGGPGCRWVGNENGFAGETNWCTLNVDQVYPGYPNAAELTLGHKGGTTWCPTECDVSIRPGWFYSPDTDGKVKSVEQLMEIYYGSIGRGSNLLLNVPVDRRGLIAKEDSTRLMEFRDAVKHDFPENLARKAKVRASAGKSFPAHNLVDGNGHTYWIPENHDHDGGVFVLQFKKPVTFTRIVLKEAIVLGQGVSRFTISVLDKGQFRQIAEQTTIGHKRILQFPKTTTDQISISVSGDSRANPAIAEVEVY